MLQPKVSVIIPVYNRERMLFQALKSVFAQDYENMEVIVINDGSTDLSRETAEQFPVKLLEVQHSGFPGKVRNIGTEHASGKYLAFLDSDDLWMPFKISKQVSKLEETGFLLCHTLEVWNRSGKIISQKKQKHKREGDLFSDCLKKCIIGPSTVLMDKELFNKTGGFREDLEIAEDYELWLRICDRVEAAYLNEPLITKKAGDWPQLSEKYGKIEYYRIEALKGLVDSAAFTEAHLIEAKSELSRKCAIYALGAEKRSKSDEAVLYNQLAEKYNAG